MGNMSDDLVARDGQAIASSGGVTQLHRVIDLVNSGATPERIKEWCEDQILKARCGVGRGREGEAMTEMIPISDEVVTGSGVDFLAQIQRRQMDAYIAQQRAELAAVCGAYAAWMMYPPTPSGDPAEYGPYWARLTDVVTDPQEREAIVASWLSAVSGEAEKR